MTTALITQIQSDIVEQVIIKGDLAQLTPPERVSYYRAVCDSVGLNPLTKPFEYINLKGKLTLYARKDATDQLRKINHISIGKPDITFRDDLIVVAVSAHDPQGREDSDIGVVKKTDMNGDAANALMKAVTKAKRRVTLSLCGLGWLDETEIETIPDAKPVKVLDDGKIDNGPSWNVEYPTTPTSEPQAPPAQPMPIKFKWPTEITTWAYGEWQLKSQQVIGALNQSRVLTPTDPLDVIKHWLKIRKAERDNGIEGVEATARADADYQATKESA